MTKLPEFAVRCYGNDDRLPREAEEMFSKELACSRTPLPEARPDRDQWRFACVCAVTADGHVLGGVHLDIGPISFGPLAKEKLAFVEAVFVRPECRGQGVGTRVMREAVSVARKAGCLHMRCNVRWDNPAAIALYRKCGFALVDISGPGETGEYFVVRPL
ncbi:MAG: GNAT family N-acetyltransferase [Planctomycetes bacterium]|nr:GNAT family N-acetyltransferase [Planctomycetota bacterium]MBM4078824.1 GNAT family N-acetyltransferase [Planctomycetota bacterium]